MKKRRQRGEDKGAFELLEEAIHLVRGAGPGVLAAYYVGSVPFILGLLYFWAEMSRSPLAGSRLETGALGVALLFLWMKGWHSLFARQLRVQMTGQAAPEMNWRQYARMVVSQGILQSSGLFLLPMALVLTLPFAWVYAFYQNLSVLADGETDLKSLLKSAAGQSVLWPRQNHLALALLMGFGLAVFFNWITVCGLGPHLIKMLLGTESVFTRSGFSFLNTTFFMSMLGLTYLTVDPIAKAAYALRCFYGLSLKTGEDLKAELRLHGRWQTQAAAFLILCGSCAGGFAGTPAHNEDGDELLRTPARTFAEGGVVGGLAPAAAEGVSPEQLDAQIERVLEERKYTWRMPRGKVAEATEKGVIARFIERVFEMFRKWLLSFVKWVDSLLRRLFNRPWQPASSGSGVDWAYTLKLLLMLLGAAVVAALLILLYRVWRRRGPKPEVVAGEPVQPVPDLASENIGADQLSEDGWMRLGAEMLEKGELRLALRAFYLATLAHLAERNLVTLASSKSNLEYLRELARRGHAFPVLRELFGENLNVFERIWYGMHEISLELVNQFAENVRRMKEGVS